MVCRPEEDSVFLHFLKAICTLHHCAFIVEQSSHPPTALQEWNVKDQAHGFCGLYLSSYRYIQQLCYRSRDRASCRLQTKYMFRAFLPLFKLALPFFCSSLDMTHVCLKPLQLFTLFLALSPSLQISHGSFSEFIQMFCSKVTFSD